MLLMRVAYIFFMLSGTPVLDQSEWHGDSKSDEWVHVTTPSPTNVPVSDTWTTSSDVYSQVKIWFRFSIGAVFVQIELVRVSPP